MTKEPLWTVAGITAAASAVIGLLSAFGLDLTEAQHNAILGVIAVAAPVVVALVTRSKVSPIDKDRRTAHPSR